MREFSIRAAAFACLVFTFQLEAQQPSARAKAIASALKASTVEYRAPVVIDTTALVKLDGVDSADMVSLKSLMGAGFIWTDNTVPEQCLKVTPKCSGQRIVGYALQGDLAIVRIIGFVVDGCGAVGETISVSLSTFTVLEHKFGGSGSCVPRDSL